MVTIFSTLVNRSVKHWRKTTELTGARAELAEGRLTGAQLDSALAAAPRKNSELDALVDISQRAQATLARCTADHTEAETRVRQDRSQVWES